MFCPYCGAKVEQDNVFCTACGKQLPKQEPVQTQEPTFTHDETIPYTPPQEDAYAPPVSPVKKRTGLKIGIAAAVAIVIIGAITVFGMRNELRYLISPMWQVGTITQNTFDDLEKETEALSKTLLGYDASEHNSSVNAQISVQADGQKIDMGVTATSTEDYAKMKMNIAANGNTLAEPVFNWDNNEVSIHIPQLNNNRYFIPVRNFKQNWNNSAFAQSLDAQIPEETALPRSLAYEDLQDAAEETREKYEDCIKRFLRRVDFGKRTKSALNIAGRDQTVHYIEFTVTATDLAAFLEDFVNVSGVILPPEANLEQLKAEAAASGQSVTLQLIEHKNRFIGIKTRDVLLYFNHNNLLDGFVAEATGTHFELIGDSKMKDGTLDYAMNVNGMGMEKQLMYFCLDNNNGTFRMNVDQQELFHLNNVKCGNGITIGSNSIPLDGGYTFDFSVSVQRGTQQIPLSGTPVNLLEKSVSEWETTLSSDLERFAGQLISQFMY